jgi:hypothetical protein
MRHVRPLTVLMMAVLLLSPVVRAQPEQSNRPQACFFSRNFEQWRAPDPSTIIIRVSVNRFYRLGLSAPCPTLQFPEARLISVFRGSDAICGPLDWDIRVVQFGTGITEQCVVKSMTRLTPEQVASTPPRFRP